jgi:predicted membrane channel-forming protein YqfA (hemolysin III family)
MLKKWSSSFLKSHYTNANKNRKWETQRNFCFLIDCDGLNHLVMLNENSLSSTIWLHNWYLIRQLTCGEGEPLISEMQMIMNVVISLMLFHLTAISLEKCYCHTLYHYMESGQRRRFKKAFSGGLNRR